MAQKPTKPKTATTSTKANASRRCGSSDGRRRSHARAENPAKVKAGRKGAAKTNARRQTQRRVRRSQDLVLHGYVEGGGNVTAACMVAGVSRDTYYRWLREDAEFAQRIADAEPQATQVLLDEAQRRAVHGCIDPIYQGGKHVGNRLRYSDRLMERLLEARLPDKFRERVSLEHSGRIEHNHVLEQVRRMRERPDQRRRQIVDALNSGGNHHGN